MPNNVDPLDQFKEVYKEFNSIRQNRGRITEADTRSALLDRLLHEVLRWPHSTIKREVYSEVGYLDYELIKGVSIAVLEAKAEGIAFEFPQRKYKSPQRLKINGVLSGSAELIAAMVQVQQYCNERGIRYAIVSNGYSFVIFRALTEGVSWRDGEAIVFESPRVIEANFTEFFNLLGYEGVHNGTLDDAFRLASATIRSAFRPLQGVVDADTTYARNRLSASIAYFVRKYFGELGGDEEALDTLQECYIFSMPIQLIDEELNIIIRDYIPDFARSTTEPLNMRTAEGARNLTQLISDHISGVEIGDVILLIAGIGAGKTTFLRRFLGVTAPDILAQTATRFSTHLDFLGREDSISAVNKFIWESLANRLVSTDDAFQDLETLESIFFENIKLLRGIYKGTPQEEEKIRTKLEELVENKEKFTRAALRRYVDTKKRVLLILDNVDQLSVPVQTHIFTIAESLSRELHCLCVLGIREETFASVIMQKHVTAYPVKAFHLASPSFQRLILRRIKYSITEIRAGTLLEDESKLGSQMQDVHDFLRMLRVSLIGPKSPDGVRRRSPQIVRLLEAVSYGNMRFALEMFNSFITSGAADTPKMLSHFRAGGYNIPFHEFLKCVVLGEHRFYREGRSAVMNVFDVSPSRNASHMTTLRVLNFLSVGNETQTGAQGFVPLRVLISSFVDIFDNEDDCLRTIRKLIQLRRQLVELDTRRTDTLDGASTVRITSAGEYYLKVLLPSFVYLDLVWQDTPLDDASQCEWLRRHVYEVKMGKRFERVESFLRYLDERETRELSSVGLNKAPSVYGPFVSDLIAAVGRQRVEILRKLGFLSPGEDAKETEDSN